MSSCTTRNARWGRVYIRDLGLLESALARPQATGFGEDAYSTLELKVAALVHAGGVHRTTLTSGVLRTCLSG